MSSKRLTRREVQYWLAPIRATLRELRNTGEADEINGFAVIRVPGDDEYVRIDYCVAGWVGCLRRILPDEPQDAMTLVGDKLAADEPLTVAELDAALSLLNRLETRLIRTPREIIRAAALAEQALIEQETRALDERAAA